MRTYQNMHTQTAYLLKYAYSKCVFNRKWVLKTRTLEEGKSQAKSIKILKSLAKFTLLLSGNPEISILATRYFLQLNQSCTRH